MITPVEKRGEYHFKRDDLFELDGSCGGKVRACLAIARGAKGLVTSGSRASPQINIVATVASHLGIPCIAHTQGGPVLPEVERAIQRGAKIIQHGAVYNSVIIKKAQDCAKETGYTEVPFGMDCWESVNQLREQVRNVIDMVDPPKRIVIPVGSGMCLSALVANLLGLGARIPVCGVRVDKNSGFTGMFRRLDKYAPMWRMVAYPVEKEHSDLAYDEPPEETKFCGIKLDPIYEAKCIPFMRAGDMLWVVGIRETAKE